MAKSLVERFSEAQTQGHRWLLECRDLWDAHDDDWGVYYQPVADDAAVDACAKHFDENNNFDRLMAIWDLSLPLAGQGSGIAPKDWVARRRRENPAGG
jgi:hypothetical protein